MTQGVADFTTDWASVELPDAWPDQLDWKHPLTAWRMVRRVAGRSRERVRLPSGLPGAERIPKYILQEFHNLPNGNFSKQISAGYARWFDRVMLGTMAGGRARLAASLQGSCRVIDLGCGGGHMVGQLQRSGVGQVVGLDASPYLLQYAAQTYPGVQWVHGMAECTGLPDASFDGASVCFLLHEVPPRYLQQIVLELRRIVRPGGRLAVLEPSPVQWHGSPWHLLRRHGWRGLYFKLLAAHAFEPFVDAWHKQAFGKLLEENGFRVEVDESGCPFRFVLATRDASPVAPAAAPL